jgi:hypothetical protein
MKTLNDRVQSLQWSGLIESLFEQGYTTTRPLLTVAECDSLISMYSDDSRFRSRIEMQRFRFGSGEYKYFADPLPETVQQLRHAFYAPLAPAANRWMELLNLPQRYPGTLKPFLDLCRKHKQAKPTPLLLRYTAGGYNCLHQDLYGEIAFPFQLTALLSMQNRDFDGGEFMLVEQRPRAQSKGEVVPLEQGQFVIFTTRYRPVSGTKGYYRANVRHGVSRLRSGTRYTLGIIFHNAQ